MKTFLIEKILKHISPLHLITLRKTKLHDILIHFKIDDCLPDSELQVEAEGNMHVSEQNELIGNDCIVIGVGGLQHGNGVIEWFFG